MPLSVIITVSATLLGLVISLVTIGFKIGKLTSKVVENTADIDRHKASADKRFDKNETALATTDMEMKKREIQETKMSLMLENLEVMVRELKAMIGAMLAK